MEFGYGLSSDFGSDVWVSTAFGLEFMVKVNVSVRDSFRVRDRFMLGIGLWLRLMLALGIVLEVRVG